MSSKLLTKASLVACLVGAFALVNPVKADAAFMAYICNDAACTGGGDTIVTDGPDGALDGVIVAIDPNLGVTITVSRSKPNVGSATSPEVDLSYSASGIGTAWVYASDTDFTGITMFSGSNDGNFAGSATISTFLCGGNSNLNLDLSSCVFGVDASASPFSVQLFKGAAGVSPYSLTLGVKIVKTTAGSLSGDFLVVPEPATMALLGLGLVGLGAASRRRAKNRR